MNRIIYLFSLLMALLFGCVSCQNSISNQIKFNDEKASREAKIVERLIDIRNAEMFYKYANDRYTGSFDTLIAFCKNNELPVIRLRPELIDTTYVVVSDTVGYISVVDSIAGRRAGFNIDGLSIVPYGDSNTQFELSAGFIDRGGTLIPVFEAKTPYDVYLSTSPTSFSPKEWNNRVRNAKKEQEDLNRYAGLKVGSMEEATVDGSWERL